MFTETTVRCLGERDRSWAVEEIKGITALDLVSLLCEFAESGWLKPLPGGCFVAHPLLPSLMRPHFTRLYGRRTERVVRAVVEVRAAPDRRQNPGVATFGSSGSGLR
ncbi:hypothetical protein [Streptomyces sp. NPDC046985]|uniref:hypothetical protein n=1 Tax=Streptomyces sp. NPDC046985 TaxID=3155377 RepID=UPI0034079A72